MEKKSIKQKEKIVLIGIYVIIGIIVLIVIILGFATPKMSEETAEFIGENSVLYTQAGCIHCIEQEKMFGENVKYLNIVDCLEETQICIDLEITATPTWLIKGKKYEGVKTLKELENLIRS